MVVKYNQTGIIVRLLYVLYPIRYKGDRMEEIGKLIKLERKKYGLTQVDFALRSGLGLRFVRELESGKATARMDKVMQALNFFGYTLMPVKLEELHK